MGDNIQDGLKSGLPPTIQLVPMSVREWDLTNPADSFRKFFVGNQSEATNSLLRDGFHPEVVYFIGEDGNGHALVWCNNDYDLEVGWIQRFLAAHTVFGIVHAVEAWLILPSSPTSRTPSKGLAVESSDPKEVLMVSGQCRNGWSATWAVELSRDAKGKPVLGACRQFKEHLGRFGKLFG